MSDSVFLELEYNIKNDKFKLADTNIKKTQISEVLADFLRAKMGEGKDNRPPNEIEVYKIRVELDLDEDTFRCSHNCGNKCLREGILLDALRREKEWNKE